jgi:ABC-2 type transport system ATP-binding protein
MPDLAIETDHLRKEYGSKVAVEDLTLQVPRGEVFGFLGPNGAGKSTTIKMLLGLVIPTAGEIKLLGQSSRNPQVRARVGFLPEHFRYHEWLKAHEFLTFHGQLYGLSRQQLKRKIPALLEMVDLSESYNLKLSDFSKGMLQRIGLAQAMLNDPALIFLDEPTSGLDPIGLRQVRDIIYRLKEAGITVFLNSHLLSEVSIVCDRVAFIKRGRVVQTSLMADLMNRNTEVTLRVDAFKPELVAALGNLGRNICANGASLSMLVDSEETLPQIAHLVHQSGARLYELSPQRKSLEEIFVDIIGRADEPTGDSDERGAT